MGIRQDSDIAAPDGTSGTGNGVDQRADPSRPDVRPSGDVDRRPPTTEHDLNAFYQSFRIQPNRRYRVQNRTPYLIHVIGHDPDHGELVLPPLGDRLIQGARLVPFREQLRLHRQRHEVFVGLHEERISTVAKLVWFAWAAVMAPLGIAVYDVVRHGRIGTEFVVASVIAGAVIAVVLAIAAEIERRRRKKAFEDGIQAGDVEVGVGGADTDGNETARDVRQLATFFFVLGVGAVLPIAAILVATDTKDFLVLEGGLHVKAGQESRLVARLIQMIYTVVLSMFPALLFFQFDRMRAGSVRSEWVRALFRMDGRMRTLADVNATYGSAMYEASNSTDDSVRGLGGKNSPIIIATILIALGWTILVIRTESFDFNGETKASQQVQVAEEQLARARQSLEDARNASTAAAANAALDDVNAATDAVEEAQEATSETAEMSTQGESESTTAAGGDDSTAPDSGAADRMLTPGEAVAAAEAEVAVAESALEEARLQKSQIQSTQFFQVLAPNPSAAGMAFLGAYFFGVYLILRSYFRGDLRSKLYNQITARLVTVVVVAYLINAIVFTDTDQQRLVWALAFLAGVVPTTVLDHIFHAAGSAVEQVVGDTFSAERPLEHIDGIDIYDAGRLESEGVPDVAALATSDLATVMLHTRMPIGRLVDWADQAALMVVVARPGPHLDPRIKCMRSRGIRTGTDLLAAVEQGNQATIQECLKVPAHAGRHGIWNDRRQRQEQANGDGDGGALDGDGSAAADGSAPPAGGEGPTPAAPELAAVTIDPGGGGDDGTPTPAAPVADGDAAHAAPATNGDADGEATTVQEVMEDVLDNDANMTELCDAIRRQPVMSHILQWRSSALDDVDKRWIPLPDMDVDPLVSGTYQGPLPAGPARQP